MLLETLLEIGMPSNLKGFRYIYTSMILITDDYTYLKCLTKYLYPEIATLYSTSEKSVERDIRHAIEVCWTYGDLDTIEELFHNSVNPNKGAPTNKQFLYGLYYYLVISPQSDIRNHNRSASA